MITEDVQKHAIEQTKRFENAATIPGTRDNHCFIPTPEGSVIAKLISRDETGLDGGCVPVMQEYDKELITLEQCTSGIFIAGLYDSNWWLGFMMETAKEKQDVRVTFMHPNGPTKKFYCRHDKEDICWIPKEHLPVTQAPDTVGFGRQFSLPDEELSRINRWLKNVKPS